VSEGENVEAFERDLASRLGLTRPLAVNSGTAALHLALVLAGVGPGDEVVLPAQTFLATGMAALMQRATPVFADIDPETGNLSPVALREKVSHRTKAILPVHWGGYPCDLDAIHAVAAEHGAAVIEDAAHALGATYGGKPVGAVSRFTCFSFQATKHLTTGDGGALCCLREEDHREGRRTRWFGIDRASAGKTPVGDRLARAESVGFKYHMNDLSAAVGRGNLEDFPSLLNARRRNAGAFREGLSNVPGLTLLRDESDRGHAHWLFTVRVERREDFARKMKNDGIPVSVVDLRLDDHPAFGGRRDDLPGQDVFDTEQISLPVHPGLAPRDIDRVIRSVRSGW
jgi:perosamine synthetase